MNKNTFYAAALTARIILDNAPNAQAAEAEQVLHIEPQTTSMVLSSSDKDSYICRAVLSPSDKAAAQATERLTQYHENEVAARSEACMHTTMKAIDPSYHANMPLYSGISTAVETGTSDERKRIEARIDRKTGKLVADFTSEALTFAYHHGKARIATQATATANTTNIFDPKATQLSLSAIWNEGPKMPGAEAQASNVMKMVDTFQSCMDTSSPMYLDASRPEGFYEGKIEANMIDAAIIKNTFTTPPSPMP